MFGDGRDAGAADEVKRCIERVYAGVIVIAKFETAGTVSQFERIRSDDEIGRRIRKRRERVVFGLELARELFVAIKNTDALRSEKPFVRTGGEHCDAELLDVDGEDSDGLHSVDD